MKSIGLIFVLRVPLNLSLKACLDAASSASLCSCVKTVDDTRHAAARRRSESSLIIEGLMARAVADETGADTVDVNAARSLGFH